MAVTGSLSQASVLGLLIPLGPGNGLDNQLPRDQLTRTLGSTILKVEVLAGSVQYEAVFSVLGPVLRWSQSPPPPAGYDHDHRFNGFSYPFPKQADR